VSINYIHFFFLTKLILSVGGGWFSFYTQFTFGCTVLQLSGLDIALKKHADGLKRSDLIPASFSNITCKYKSKILLTVLLIVFIDFSPFLDRDNNLGEIFDSYGNMIEFVGNNKSFTVVNVNSIESRCTSNVTSCNGMDHFSSHISFAPHQLSFLYSICYYFIYRRANRFRKTSFL
jgi:hypothetical protein